MVLTSQCAIRRNGVKCIFHDGIGLAIANPIYRQVAIAAAQEAARRCNDSLALGGVYSGHGEKTLSSPPAQHNADAPAWTDYSDIRLGRTCPADVSDDINTHLPTGTTPVVGTGLLDACAHSALSWRRSPFQQRNCPDLPRRHRPRLPHEPARTRESGSHPRRAKPRFG